jgi:putative oxidoreductase
MRKTIEACYSLLERAGNAMQSPFLLLVRLYWGWQFAETGWGKLHHLDTVTTFFTNLGIPLPGFNAPFVSALEFVGGILLALGLGSRVIALLLAGDMLVAYLTKDRDALFSVFSDPNTFTGATPYAYLFASLLILIFGPGKLALDALFGKRAPGAS